MKKRSSKGERERGAYQTEFGKALHRLMESRSVSQTRLAAAAGRSTSYVNKTMKGVKPANAEWCGMVADVLRLQEAERQRLRRAAALDLLRDHEFDDVIDLKK